jgi:hypothetical protein
MTRAIKSAPKCSRSYPTSYESDALAGSGAGSRATLVAKVGEPPAVVAHQAMMLEAVEVVGPEITEFGLVFEDVPGRDEDAMAEAEDRGVRGAATGMRLSACDSRGGGHGPADTRTEHGQCRKRAVSFGGCRRQAIDNPMTVSPRREPGRSITRAAWGPGAHGPGPRRPYAMPCRRQRRGRPGTSRTLARGGDPCQVLYRFAEFR